MQNAQNQRKEKEKPRKINVSKYILAYLFYKYNSIDETIRLGFDPLTGAKIERRYISDMQDSSGRFVLGYYEPARHTITLPYEHESPNELRDTFLHEVSHALGSTYEPTTEAFAQDVLKRQYQNNYN